MNEFKAGFVFHKEVFGSLNVVEKIVNSHLWPDLMKLCDLASSSKWTLLDRESEDENDLGSKLVDQENTSVNAYESGPSNILEWFSNERSNSSIKKL